MQLSVHCQALPIDKLHKVLALFHSGPPDPAGPHKLILKIPQQIQKYLCMEESAHPTLPGQLFWDIYKKVFEFVLLPLVYFFFSSLFASVLTEIERKYIQRKYFLLTIIK